MECTVKSKKADRDITIDYDFGSDLADFVEKFGEAAAYNHAVASAKLSVNSFVRPMLEAAGEDGTQTHSDEQIRSALGAWVLPDKTGRTVDKAAKILKLMSALSPEKKAEILAALSGESIVSEPEADYDED